MTRLWSDWPNSQTSPSLAATIFAKPGSPHCHQMVQIHCMRNTHPCPPICLVCVLLVVCSRCSLAGRVRDVSTGERPARKSRPKRLPFFYFIFFAIVLQRSNRRTRPIPVRARRPVISPATVKSSPWSRSPARARLAISPGSTTSPRTTSGTTTELLPER